MKSIFDAVDRMSDALTFHRDRHSVLAGNLANLDTPGYKPLDLERRDPVAAPNLPMAVTEPGHLQAANGPAGENLVDSSDPNPSVDGNAVNLEREMAKVAANRVRYGTTSELVSRRLALLKYAASDGS
jgi:flagellar basal-body rod protein FlgB